MNGKRRILIAVLFAAVCSAAFGVSALAKGSTRAAGDSTLIVGIENPRIGFPFIPNERDIQDAVSAVRPGAFVHLARACAGAAEVPEVQMIRFSSPAGADRAARRLRKRAEISFVTRPRRIRKMSSGEGTPVAAADSASAQASLEFENEPLYGQQWALNNTGQELPGATPAPESNPPRYYEPVADADVDAPEAWRRGVSGKGVVIAVLDEGVNTRHPDLEQNIWRNPGEAGPLANNGVDDDGNGWTDDHSGWDVVGQDNENFAGYDHGTGVASVAAADGRNGVGMTGLAPDAKIMPVRFIANTLADQFAEIAAIEAFAYAIANGADVINNSWGWWNPTTAGDPILELAIQCAAAKGIFISWSGGNAGPLTEFPAGYPTHSNVIVAGGESANGCFVGGFQWSPAINDTLAPAWDVMAASTHSASGYEMVEGTSFAAPLVAGAAALAIEANPRITPPELKRAFLLSGRAPYAQPYAKSLGFLNAPALLDAAADPAAAPEVEPFDLDADLACRGQKPAEEIARNLVLTTYGLPGAFYKNSQISGMPEPLQSIWDNRPPWPLPDDLPLP